MLWEVLFFTLLDIFPKFLSTIEMSNTMLFLGFMRLSRRKWLGVFLVLLSMKSVISGRYYS